MGKRLFDLIGASLLLGVTLMLLPFIALAIRLDSEGPVFYRQFRVGKGGKLFRIWKFRTMRVGTERPNDRVCRGDPRVTRVGRLLRARHLDELPQCVNVFLGEMSLVGPRPSSPEEGFTPVGSDPWHSTRLLVRPGITGLGQVMNAGRRLTFRHVCRLDDFYVKHRHAGLDTRILTCTFRHVLRGLGV